MYVIRYTQEVEGVKVLIVTIQPIWLIDEWAMSGRKRHWRVAIVVPV